MMSDPRLSATPDAVSSVPAADLARISDEFGLGAITDTAYLSAGLMNRNWRVQTPVGAFALKLLLDVSPSTARRSAAVTAELATAGLPVCTPLTTHGGESVLMLGERAYLVSPWAEGEHVAGTALPLPQVRELGVLVGRIHRALASASVLDVALLPPTARVVTPEVALTTADRLLEAASRRKARDDQFDELARHLLEERKILIDKHRAAQPAGGTLPGMFGWTHGDLQHRNILRSSGTVTAVLDWDRIAIKPLGEEVARTAQVQFGGEEGRFDLDRVAAFVAGYRTVVPLPVDDLADAVHRLWWKRLTDFWVFEYHYDRGDFGPDHLMAPSEALLSWWTDRRNDVVAAFTGRT